MSAASIEEDSSIVQPMQLYEYAWKVTSNTIYSTGFGGWRTGPTGLGPGTLNVNQSTTVSRSYTNTISGSYSIGKPAISAATGITIGKALTHGTSYTIKLASGERKTIIFRPKTITRKVVSKYYRYPIGTTGSPVVLKTETCYVKYFNGWDYSWRYGY